MTSSVLARPPRPPGLLLIAPASPTNSTRLVNQLRIARPVQLESLEGDAYICYLTQFILAKGLLLLGPAGAMSSCRGGRGSRARTDDVIMPSLTVICCRSFFETDSYIFLMGP